MTIHIVAQPQLPDVFDCLQDIKKRIDEATDRGIMIEYPSSVVLYGYRDTFLATLGRVRTDIVINDVK